MILEDLFRNPLHLITLLVIVALVMGGGRLKDTMGGLGTGIKEFKKAIKDDEPAAQSSTMVSPAPVVASPIITVAATNGAPPAAAATLPAGSGAASLVVEAVR